MRVVLALAVILIAACRAPAAASPSAAPIAVGSPSTAPQPSVAAPSAAPSVFAPTPRPTPTPAAWSKPIVIDGLSGCGSVVAAVDETGDTHLAATCELEPSEIRYAVSDGPRWITTTLPPPDGRSELDPQLAFSGSTLYLGYSRVAAEEGGCGDDGLADVGAFVRMRTLPTGEWSEPVRIGRPTDHLRSLRVTGATIHATVFDGKAREVAYVSVTDGATERVTLPGARDTAALRIGDDGMPRIAYADNEGIAFATIHGVAVHAERLPESGRGWNPVLALAPGNGAYLLWTESNNDGGCAEPEPPPTDGTYFGTNTGETWVASRLTPMIGPASLTVDPSSREVHALVGNHNRLVWFHRGTDEQWNQETVVPEGAATGVIRQDPTSRRLVVAYVLEGGPDRDERHVEVITR